MSTQLIPISVREHLEIALHVVEEAPYERLSISNSQRPDWILSHVLSGEVHTSTRGYKAVAQTGDVMVHPPGVPFEEHANFSGIHQWIAFEARVWPQLDILQRHSLTLVVKLLDANFYNSVFQQLLQAWHQTPQKQLSQTQSSRDLRIAALALTLISHVVESWESAGATPRPHDLNIGARFASVLTFMSENLSRKISRDELAQSVHLHPVSFDRAFRAQYGMAPMQMLRDLRLQHACRLLESSNFTLDTIARQCGLGDAAHLSRAFRNRFGVSPGAFRQGLKTTKSSYIAP
jgi:AraC-like DNA-binding protein